MKKSIILLFLLSSLFFSCKKETNTYLTQGQLTALRMEKDFGIAPNAIATFNSIWIFNQSNSSVISNGAIYATITSDGFIIISGPNYTATTYNLENLKSYSVVPNSNLNLFF
jgi:hypothetical protein